MKSIIDLLQFITTTKGKYKYIFIYLKILNESWKFKKWNHLFNKKKLLLIDIETSIWASSGQSGQMKTSTLRTNDHNNQLTQMCKYMALTSYVTASIWNINLL